MVGSGIYTQKDHVMISVGAECMGCIEIVKDSCENLVLVDEDSSVALSTTELQLRRKDEGAARLEQLQQQVKSLDLS